MPKSSSLQTRLIRGTLISSIIAGLIAFVLLIAITVVHTMTIQDEIMDEVSDLLLASDLNIPSARDLNELTEEFDLQYSLYWKGRELVHSDQHEDIQPINLYASDFDYFFYKGQLWRSLHASKSEAELNVVVIQPLSARFSEIFQSIFWYALGLVILWIIQWILLKWTIKKQLSSLSDLSRSIAQRSTENLEPIQQEPNSITELQPVINSLNSLLIRLERALSAEQRFTADASHELRSPLSAIQMRVQVMQRKFADMNELNEDLKIIQHDVQRSTRILENLLLLARLDPSQAEELPKTQLDMTVLMEDVYTQLENFAQAKAIRYTVHQYAQRTHVYGNYELIYTCVRNVLDNAIRYTPVGGQIDVELLNEQDHLIIKIQDEGNTLDAALLTQLGQRFFRALGTKQPGTGLGLSITKKIIELHQGRVDFSLSAQGGLIVKLILPNAS